MTSEKLENKAERGTNGGVSLTLILAPAVYTGL